jgi:hypothetical protein
VPVTTIGSESEVGRRRKRVYFIVSDEGISSAARSAMVANEVVRRAADVVFQTHDPLSSVARLLSPRVATVSRFNLSRLGRRDGAVDRDATVEAFAGYEERLSAWASEMASSPEVAAADVVVSDIVEEAGALHDAVGVPVVFVSNSTWHWTLRKIDDRLDQVAGRMESHLAKAREFMYPPFSVEPASFPHRSAVPVISRPRRDPFVLREELGIDAWRPVLVTDGWSCEEAGVHLDCRPWLIVDREGLGGGLGRFRDYANVADLVVSRGGYSALSDTVADGVRHLIVEEDGNPESRACATLAEASHRALRCTWSQFMEDPEGWVEDALTAYLNLDPMPAYGAEVVASRVLELASSH